MELAEARALVKDKTDKDITVRHLVSVEGVMRALARRFGEDERRWALAPRKRDTKRRNRRLGATVPHRIRWCLNLRRPSLRGARLGVPLDLRAETSASRRSRRGRCR
jgi:hypothetical protein